MSYFKVFIYALLTAPLILFNVSHATLYTTGDLQYDSGTGVITNQQTQQTYLGWDVLSSYTYDQTVAATASGEAYGDYHIADYDEAKTFFEAAMFRTCDVTSGTTTTCGSEVIYGEDTQFGDNAGGGWLYDHAWFISGSSTTPYVGQITMSNPGLEHYFYDNYAEHKLTTTGTLTSVVDLWGKSTVDRGSQPITWLLVANTTLSPVPVPAAIWLFGTALIGLVGYGKRKSKVPV